MASRRVAIIDGARTPFVKAGAEFKSIKPRDLAVHAVDGLLDKTGIDPESVDHLVYGIVVLDARTPHFAREVTFASKVPSSARSITITDNCITSNTAIAMAADAIASGRSDVAIAGGVDSMSNPSLLWSRNATRVFVDLAGARSVGDKVKTLARLRPSDLAPQSPGVAEPSTGLTMGEHCEVMVKEWSISRLEQDEIAYRSHMNAAAATEDGRLTGEIVPLEGVERDTIVRSGTTMEKLAKLPPVFDRSPTGTLTAGNSSPLTDGASAILLMSEEKAKELGLEPLAYLRSYEFASIDPEDGLLMAPGVAVPRLLRREGVELEDIDIVEMHEAFGGQVACNLAAWEQGWKEPSIGKVDRDKLNPLGSSIAVGHPFAATGARIVTTLAHEMARRDAKLGLVSVCGAGATAAAMLIERD